MSDEELMNIAFSYKRTVKEILQHIFKLGEQKGRADAIDELVEALDNAKFQVNGAEAYLVFMGDVRELAEQAKAGDSE